MSGTCRDVETLLSPYLDGELDEASVRRVEEHLATCASCRAVLETWRESEAAMAASTPVRSDVEWERLARRVDAAIEAEEESGARRGTAAAAGGGRHWWLWGGSGALVAAALIALFWPWVVPRPGEPPAMITDDGRVAPRAIAAERPDRRPAPVADSVADEIAPPPAEAPVPVPAPPRVDVRRVALAQEQPAATALLSPAPPAAGGALSQEDLASRFRVLSAREEPRPLVRDLAKGAPGVKARAAFEDAASPAPADRAAPELPLAAETPPARAPDLPARVLHWADERRRAGEIAPAREAYALLADFAGDVDREEVSFGLADVDARAALADGGEASLRDAAAQLDDFARRHPASPRRPDVLAQRVRVLAALAVADPGPWCDALRAAREGWRRAAAPGAAFPDPAPAAHPCGD